MQGPPVIPEPLFELKGRFSFIDLSAWISGLSYLSGLALIGPAQLKSGVADGGVELFLLPLSYIAFFVAVLAIQRHMRLSLLANTFASPQKLVTTGVFRYSRNPIYVAFFLPLASLACLSLSAAITAIGLYMLAMNLTVIRIEERDLLKAFGPDFSRYLAQVPRWLI
jgi:protein-S-isoprenylcysteine O-methyltransferase Ste14